MNKRKEFPLAGSMNKSYSYLIAYLTLVSLASAAELDEGARYFEAHIRPVLVDTCYACHSQEQDAAEGELVLDNRQSLLRGGHGGAVIVPGDPAASRLIAALEYNDAALQMPPDGKLSEETIAAFRQWVAMGAPDPRDGEALEIETIAGRAAEHWAFQKPVRPEAPADDSGWSRSDADRLIRDELRQAGLQPSDESDRRTLIQRVYFDLIGLAPTFEEIEAFVADPRPDAYERIVDQLLASPQFGERWARHWLDLARFADTKGYVFTEDRNFPNAFKYRDWVINALNSDMPIDQFIQYQLAADQMAGADSGDQHLAAQGFVTLGRRFTNNPHDIIADRIDVIFRSTMGLSVTCARCHDHKYDPISDEDYYAVYGVLHSSREVQDEVNPMRLVDKDEPANVAVFIRGSAKNRGEMVERGLPEFFSSFAEPVNTGSGRLELAKAIVDPDNPLTARVFVNRVWGHLFGEQLVRTPSDFGLRCPPPRQQRLLDWLAVQFSENGWSLKQLVRELATSSTYRQTSVGRRELLAADPENELWGRANRRRLDFESLRDRLLDAVGQLDKRVGGASENIASGDGGSRRTVYAHIDRQNLPALFRTFDFASPDAHSPERARTLVPQQSLFLMNSPLVRRVATALSSADGERTDEQLIDHYYRSILARRPSATELALARQFLGRKVPVELPPDEWSYGMGHVDAGHVQFQALPHFAENRWQPRGAFPDAQLGHVSVNPSGGHPGHSQRESSVRRWTAPEGGTLAIQGKLERPESKGDGIVGMLVSSRQGVIGQWIVPHGSVQTEAKLDNVAAGETIDFVVSCGENDSYDTYHWRATLSLEVGEERLQWHTEQGFRGPAAEPLDLSTQLAQVLLMSNEFLFID